MVTQDKSLQAEVLKETYVLLADASALYYALKLYHQSQEDIPHHLVEMFENRLGEAVSNMVDVVHPFPF